MNVKGLRLFDSLRDLDDQIAADSIRCNELAFGLALGNTLYQVVDEYADYEFVEKAVNKGAQFGYNEYMLNMSDVKEVAYCKYATRAKQLTGINTLTNAELTDGLSTVTTLHDSIYSEHLYNTITQLYSGEKYQLGGTWFDPYPPKEITERLNNGIEFYRSMIEMQGIK